MKFTILFSAIAASVLELPPAAPFTALGDEYAKLLTVDPKIAINTGRPNCLLNKCHLKNKVTGGKICISIKAQDGPVYGYAYEGGSWEQVEAPIFVADQTANSDSGELQGFGYSCINYVVGEGKYQWLGDWIKTMDTPVSSIATLHLSDYLALVQVAGVKAKIHFIEIHVLAPADVTSVSAIENILWLVTDQNHGQKLFEKTRAQNIVIREEASFNGDVLAGDEGETFCPEE